MLVSGSVCSSHIQYQQNIPVVILPFHRAHPPGVPDGVWPAAPQPSDSAPPSAESHRTTTGSYKGPLPVISRVIVITLISRVITQVTHLFLAISRISGRGAHLLRICWYVLSEREFPEPILLLNGSKNDMGGFPVSIWHGGRFWMFRPSILGDFSGLDS